MNRGIIVGAILFVLPISVSALSSSDAQIQALLAQIQVLQAKILQLQPSKESDACVVPSRQPLRIGDSGNEVALLQAFLARDKMMYPEGRVTGFFGELTKTAVERFQTRYLQLSATNVQGFGEIGPRTLAVIRKQAGCPDQYPSTDSSQNSQSSTGSTQSSPKVTVSPITITMTTPSITETPKISVTLPVAGSSVFEGGGLAIAWKTERAPEGATVSLSLERATANIAVGDIATGLRSSGGYFWNVPSGQQTNTSSCANNPITCISHIGGDSSCDGAFCSLVPDTYKILASLVLNGYAYAQAESAPFLIKNPSATVSATSSLSLIQPSDTSASSYAALLAALSSVAPVANTTLSSCLYSGVSYSDGISLTVNCADVSRPLQSCGSFGGLLLTCHNGHWLDSSGATTSVPNITAPTGGGCRTPWQSQLVANGNEIPYAPYFTNGIYSTSAYPPIAQCSSGTWLLCDWIGANCKPSPLVSL